MPLLQDVPDLSHDKYLRVQVLLRSRGFLSSPPAIREYLLRYSFPQLLCYGPLWIPRYFANLLVPMKWIDPAEAMSRIKLWRNSMIVLEQPVGRSSRFCRRSDSHFWSDVAHFHWTTHKCNRALQEYLRATAQRREHEDHAHNLALLRSSGPLHWLSLLFMGDQDLSPEHRLFRRGYRHYPRFGSRVERII